jgi:putative ABC transport system permease protein
VLINETAAKTMGWTDALGKKVERLNMKSSEFVTSEVIGVVEDFPARSLKYEQQPVVLILTDDAAFGGSNALARLDADQIPETLAALQALWTKFAPTHPFEYAFLDERFDALYRAEQQLRLLLGTFAALAVLIACLGLFGLAVYTAERRAKEIGIRKVLGASVPSLVTLLSKEFALLVLAAFVIATPLAYVAMQRWLEDFAYRTDIGAGVFLLAGGLALLITLLTVGYQAVRAALADPVKSLRYE